MPLPTVRSIVRLTTLTVPLLGLPAAVAQMPAVQQSIALASVTLPDAPSALLVLTAQSSSPAQSSSSVPSAQPAPAQQANPAQQPTPAVTPPPLTPEERRAAAEAQLQAELHQRMAGVVPNFNAVLGGTALPLSPGQKMRAAFRSAVDPYQFGLALITSAYGQATDSHSSIDANGFRHGYEQGLIGFGKRYGADYADQFDGTIIGNGILPVLLKQDARYYRMGTGSFKRRFFYSLSTTVVCRGDNGKLQPNWSNVLGNIAAGGISNVYYPKADRGFALTIEQGMTVTAEGSFGALLIEFYPDIRKHIHGKTLPAPVVPDTSVHTP